VQYLFDLVNEFQIPSLREFGLQPEGFDELVALARQSSSMRYNPVKLSDESLREILQKAW